VLYRREGARPAQIILRWPDHIPAAPATARIFAAIAAKDRHTFTPTSGDDRMSDIELGYSHPETLLITINRPDKRNAMNKGVRDGLRDAFETLENDPGLRVGVLTGAGQIAFCAGADLQEMAGMGLAVPPRGFFPMLGETVRITKPVIAAVNGDALAGGWMLAQMCDLCVAARHARFGITEGRVGRGFPWAAPLIHMIPQKVMAEILMTGRPITSQRAYEIGFVNAVVDGEELLTSAFAVADDIRACAPLTVAATKDLLALATDMGRSAAMEAATFAFDKVYRSQDAQEGPRAFMEKRAPNWSGK
jgi:enoyl-CoA hydratase